ncbi:helix-turn-helix domain-containing protein [Frigoribacterium sp. CFBP 13712]|uniref:AraC family transcriptional regulator n=1 Tax=Frigoribacterium sp. CFBP 13712 TaxID=2775309 RepID=UPI001785D140|nr:helix-turn-helix domain-containing protein [Frigoribacterium sp. CFBP 13712]MBD8704326.1 AraC family transcriptional regulator [Frigoribacterium sp. CFBP 13712]
MTSTYTPHDAPAAEPSPPTGGFDRFQMSGEDLEEARAGLETSLEGREFRARRAEMPFSYRFASAGDSRLSLQSGTFLAHIQGVIPWSKDYIVSWFRSGAVTIDHPGGQLSSDGSRPFLTPSETSYSFTMTPHRHGIVHFGASFLEDVATERHGGPPQRIVFDYAAVPDAAALSAWQAALGAATPLIVAPATPPLARHSAQASLAGALLDLFPWRAVDVPEALRTEHTRKLRQAAEYVHAFADQPITAGDIASAAGVHTRTLQQLMSQHLGSSPTTYLRHVRLDRARQDLLAADPGSDFVAGIARRWGFGNLGRFSAAYAARFGEYPRDTLSRW